MEIPQCSGPLTAVLSSGSEPVASIQGSKLMFGMKRREFITLLGGTAAAWPLTVRAQQAQGVPVVGFLHPGVPESGSPVFNALREGLRETGYVEGDNVKSKRGGRAADRN